MKSYIARVAVSNPMKSERVSRLECERERRVLYVISACAAQGLKRHHFVACTTCQTVQLNNYHCHAAVPAVQIHDQL